MRRQLLFLTLALIIGASMTLFDTDKHNEDRSTPIPNRSDTLAEGAVQSHGTLSANYFTDASSVASSLRAGFFKIVGSGTIDIISSNTKSIGSNGFTNNIVGVADNILGYKPAVVLGVTTSNVTGLGTGSSTPLPFSITGSAQTFGGSVNNSVIWTLSIQADSTSIYIISQLLTIGTDTTTINTPALTIQYYLLN